MFSTNAREKESNVTVKGTRKGTTKGMRDEKETLREEKVNEQRTTNKTNQAGSKKSSFQPASRDGKLWSHNSQVTGPA